ncbi:hypothetical protein ACFQ0O_36400 [Saccharopolyspora spinosporotrichia]
MCSDSAAARSERADAVSSLSAYGWDDDLETSFAPHRRAGLVPARVVGVDRGRCDVVTGAGPLRVAFSAADGPCTGDWAAVRPASGGEPALVALLPRRTAIVRAAPRARRTARCWPPTSTRSPWSCPQPCGSTPAGSSGCSHWVGRAARCRS